MNSKEQHDQTLLMASDYENGMSLKEIGRKYGMSKRDVWTRLQQQSGVKMRPASGLPSRDPAD